MRVSPRELKAVRAGGLVSRYALLGDAAFVVADLPDAGTAGTSVEERCRLEHWGLVLQGDLTLHARRTRTFGSGTAFYVPPGPVHRFSASSRVPGLLSTRMFMVSKREPISSAPYRSRHDRKAAT